MNVVLVSLLLTLNRHFPTGFQVFLVLTSKIVLMKLSGFVETVRIYQISCEKEMQWNTNDFHKPIYAADLSMPSEKENRMPEVFWEYTLTHYSPVLLFYTP